jgi:hypothetical protein
MHRLQDNWTHYAKGFRSTWFHGWHPKHWIYGHGGALTFPDNDHAAWQVAAKVTQTRVIIWNQNCCQDKSGKWVKKKYWMLCKMKIKRFYLAGCILAFSWILYSIILEIGNQSGDFKGFGLYFGGLPFTMIAPIYNIWRKYYVCRVIIMIMNALFLGFVFGTFCLFVKIIVKKVTEYFHS